MIHKRTLIKWKFDNLQLVWQYMFPVFWDIPAVSDNAASTSFYIGYLFIRSMISPNPQPPIPKDRGLFHAEHSNLYHIATLFILRVLIYSVIYIIGVYHSDAYFIRYKLIHAIFLLRTLYLLHIIEVSVMGRLWLSLIYKGYLYINCNKNMLFSEFKNSHFSFPYVRYWLNRQTFPAGRQ